MATINEGFNSRVLKIKVSARDTDSDDSPMYEVWVEQSDRNNPDMMVETLAYATTDELMSLVKEIKSAIIKQLSNL